MRKSFIGVLILTMLMSFVMGQNALDFGQIWKKGAGRPLINTVGDSGAWNGSSDAWNWNWGHVLEDADTFKLYIGGSDGTNYSIGMWYSTSIDSGWTEYAGNPVLVRSEFGWDSAHVGGCTVIKDGNTYKMWYTGTAHLETHGGNKTIGYATSTDGVNWDKHPDPVIDPTLFLGNGSWVWVDNPYVIQDLNTDTLRMWFGVSQINPTFEAIYYGYSIDGLNWVFPRLTPVLAPMANHWLGIPYVQKREDGYYMWAMEGSYGNPFPANTIFVKSTDGLDWQRDHLYNPVLRRGEIGSFDATGVGIYGVFETDEGYSALYAAWGGAVEAMQVGLAKYTPTHIAAGNVSGTWTQAGSPYRVQGEITIPNGETLTIEPGTTVEFLTHDPLLVQGRLLASGNAIDPIRFWVDDTLGIHDLAGSEGVWGGIRFDETPESNDSSYISYTDIQFAKNFAGSGAGIYGRIGGGLYIKGVDKLCVEYSTIKNNYVIGNYDDTDAAGGGIAIQDASPEIKFNSILDNKTKHLIHNTWSHGGGMLIMGASSASIIGNTIKNNRCGDVGGGVAIWGQGCDPMLINNLIVENRALCNVRRLGYGGGVGAGGNCSFTLMNNTIANNQAGWGGGGVYFNGGTANIINTIIADNIHTNSPEFEDWGHDLAAYGNSMLNRTLNFQNSCLEGGPELIMWGIHNTGDPGEVVFEASLSIDPWLAPNYTLNSSRSPCIGSGTACCSIDGVTYDALPQDMTGHNCPDPSWSCPDMGAIESDLAAHRVTNFWNWYPATGDLVMSPGATGTPDDISVTQPDILYHNQQYHMYYSGYDGDRMTICHATSPDGIVWTKNAANPILVSDPATWHGESLQLPRVIIIDEVYHMWFRSNNRVGHAVSQDGLDWTFTGFPVLEGTLGTWDGDLVAFAEVIYSDSLFQAWFCGSNNNIAAIGYATSEDGVEWQKLPDPVFEASDDGWDSGLIYASSVVSNGGYYYMWYSANDGTELSRIGRASSLDGINWARITRDDPEIEYGEQGSWNAAASFYPNAIIHNGLYEIWFNGVPTRNSGWSIGRSIMTPTAADPKVVELPQTFLLSQNYPNPFNPMTHIRYSLPENGDIRLVVYDILGREVVELVNGYRNVGNYEITWYGLDKNGNQVSTGVYFARLEASRKVDVIKMLHLK